MKKIKKFIQRVLDGCSLVYRKISYDAAVKVARAKSFREMNDPMNLRKRFFYNSDAWKLDFGEKARLYFKWREIMLIPQTIFLSLIFERFRMYKFKPPFVGWLNGDLEGSLDNSTTMVNHPVKVTGRIINRNGGSIEMISAASEVINLKGFIGVINGDIKVVQQWGSSDVIDITGNLCVYPGGKVTGRIRCRNLFVWGDLSSGGMEVSVEVDEYVYLMDCTTKFNGFYGQNRYLYGKSEIVGILEPKNMWDKKKAALLIPTP